MVRYNVSWSDSMGDSFAELEYSLVRCSHKGDFDLEGLKVFVEGITAKTGIKPSSRVVYNYEDTTAVVKWKKSDTEYLAVYFYGSVQYQKLSDFLVN